MVITDLEAKDIATFLKRPWTLVIYVTAPLLARYHRHISANANNLGTAATLEQYVKETDDLHIAQAADQINQYNPAIHSHLTVFNNYPDLSGLHEALDVHGLDILNKDRLRPSWDSYFMYVPIKSKLWY